MIKVSTEQVIGYVVVAIVTLGGFIALMQKITQPINDLRIVIQELRDCINALKSDNTTQNKRLDKHGEEIDKLNNRVGNIETKINLYHGK